jgi:transposase
MTKNAVGARPLFPPEVGLLLVKLACCLPDDLHRSLNHWTCSELRDQLLEAKVVPDISVSQVQRILASHKLKPWRVHSWMTPKAPPDGEFLRMVEVIQDLYSRPQDPSERVLCLDELTSIQPRPRSQPNKAPLEGEPVRVEHEYKRAGALNLLAAFDIHTGQVTHICRRRKRQVEFIELLEQLDRESGPEVKTIYLVCDNVRMHKGKLVQEWLAKHPRFRMVHPPVHCSWMNQVEQWFSIIKRKRLTFANFENCEELERRIFQFVRDWNKKAHPFNWSKKSFAKVIARVEDAIAKAA